MVYAYQIVYKPLASELLHNETCPVCNKKGVLELTLYMRYISALLPVYGMGRCTGVRCTVCNEVIKSPQASVLAKKRYPESIASAIDHLRRTHKRTIWQLLYPWSLCLLLLLGMGAGLVYSRIQRYKAAKTKELIAHPQPGDVYKSIWQTHNGEGQGAKVRVARINGDTLFVVISERLMPAEANYYDAKEWDKLSGTAFSTKEFKLRLSSFTGAADFFEYGANARSAQLSYIGYVLGKGVSNLSFEVVERP